MIPTRTNSRRGLVIAIVGGLSAVLLIAAWAYATRSTYDIDASCRSTRVLSTYAGTITNTSGTEQDFEIEVAFKDGQGDVLDTGRDFVRNVQPDRDAVFEVTGRGDAKTCEVVRVT